MNRVLYAISLTLCVAAAFLWANPAQADTMLDQSSAGGSGDVGAYEGACWKLSDAGFALTGDALVQAELLQSVTFMHGPGHYGETGGDLYLKVFSGDTGGLGTFVGVSTSTINAGNYEANGLMTWTFSSLALDKDTTYSYVFGASDDSSNPSATIRLQASSYNDPALLASGGLINSDAVADVGWSPVASVTLVPEPSTTVLLTSGLLGLLAYAWRKRR